MTTIKFADYKIDIDHRTANRLREYIGGYDDADIAIRVMLNHAEVFCPPPRKKVDHDQTKP